MQRIKVTAGFTKVLVIFVLIQLVSSCSTRAEMTIGKDRRATITLKTSIPPEIEVWVRRNSRLPLDRQLFNPDSTAAALRSRGLTVLGIRILDQTTQELKFEAADLLAFIESDSRLKEAGLITYESGKGWASLRMTITNANAAALISLFPGLDLQLLEALQPPALFYNPVSTAEYRSMLGVLMGRTAAAALDTTMLNIQLVTPGPISDLRGLTLVTGSNPSSAGLSIPVVEAMVLEKPIDIYLKWHQ